MPVVGKIMFFKTDLRFTKLHPRIYKKHDEKFGWLESQYSNIGNYLIGNINNYIKLSNNDLDPTKGNKPFKKDMTVINHVFNSACFYASQGRYDEALDALELSVRNGFSNEEHFSEALNKYFIQVKDKAEMIWKKRY